MTSHPCPPNVVPAEIRDEEPLMHLLRLRHEEEGEGPFDQWGARATLRRGIQRQHAMIGVIRHGSLIEASVGIYVEKPWDTDRYHLEPRWSFVAEPYRKSNRAKDLIQFAKWTAEMMRLPLFSAVVANERTKHKVELMGRQLPKAGEVFVFVPAPAA